MLGLCLNIIDLPLHQLTSNAVNLHTFCICIYSPNFTYCIAILRQLLAHLHKLIIGFSLCKKISITKPKTSVMAIRRKNSPSGDGVSEKISGKQGPKPVARPREKDVSIMPLGSYSNDCFPFRNGSLVSSLDHSSSDHRTFFNNQSKVEQWVANSASGSDASFVQFTPYDQAGASKGNNALPGAGPDLPGSLSVSRSHVSHVSLQHSAQTAGPNGSWIINDDVCTANAGARINSVEFSRGLDFEAGADFLGEQYHHDIWSTYQTPVDEDTLFSNHVAVNSTGVNNESVLCSEWTTAAFQASDDLLTAPIPCTSQSVSWTPALVVDPSVSSSYSQSSLLVPRPNTPLSPATHEDVWCATQRNPEEEAGVYPQFSIGDAAQFPSPVYTDGNVDLRFVQYPSYCGSLSV